MENQQFIPAPDNHLVKAVLTTLFCCLPFGIISLLHATKVEGLWLQGQRVQAQREAQEADKWANIAIVCGVVSIVIYFICLLVAEL